MNMKKILKIVDVSVLAVLVIALIFSVVTMATLDVTKLNSMNRSTILFDRYGEKVALLSGRENRTVIPLDDIPLDVQRAFIAAEDARFYTHPGIDMFRIGGALVQNIKTRDYAQGASTITQQLIKLTHLTNDKTILRKVREALMAIRLEWLMSKDEILESYLNTVYFGAGAYGIEAAAQQYFGMPANELTLSQGALLAGIIKSPSHYAPHLNVERSVARRNLVLNEMMEAGYITQNQVRQAKEQDPILIDQNANATPFSWFVDAACDEAVELINIDYEQLLSGGYRLYTTLDQTLQSNAESLFLRGDLFPANASDSQPVQAALVCADTHTGSILSLVGGREYITKRGLNRATGIRRQPGSAFKPISVYAAAVDAFGYLPTSLLDDTKRDFNGYEPGNAGGTYAGTVTLRQALSRSLNVATVDLLNRFGVESARLYAQHSGIELTNEDSHLALALGALTHGVSPVELNAAYAPLSNGGQRVMPHCIERIEDSDGRVLYQFIQPTAQVMSESSARLITDMLMTAAQSGTARALSSLAFPVAGKTGTVGMKNGGNRDIWSIAYTPTASVAIWMGFDQPDATHKMPDAASGSNQPMQLAAAFLAKGGDLLGGQSFSIPSGLKEVLIDRYALETVHKPMLVSELTPKSYAQTELFPETQTPNRVSDVWKPPSRVFDLRVAPVSGGTQIEFTAVDDFALYRVYRIRDNEATLIATLSGVVGDMLSYVDGEDYRDALYSVTAVHKTLLEEGIELAGQPSAARQIARAMEWIQPEDEPEPEETPEPVKPLPLAAEDTL